MHVWKQDGGDPAERTVTMTGVRMYTGSELLNMLKGTVSGPKGPLGVTCEYSTEGSRRNIFSMSSSLVSVSFTKSSPMARFTCKKDSTERKRIRRHPCRPPSWKCIWIQPPISVKRMSLSLSETGSPLPSSKPQPRRCFYLCPQTS